MEFARKRISYPKRLTVTKRVVTIAVLLCSVAIIWFCLPKTKPPSGVSSFIGANGTEYKFPCVISQPEAISSIDRANSDKCKIVIADAACRSVHGRLFPASIAHHCPSGKYVPYRSVGCFPYDSSLFAVSQYNVDNTPKSCVDACMIMGFRYAGVVRGVLCFCGDTEPKYSLLQPETKCNQPCSGNPNQMCGGKAHASIYETGLAKHPTEPMKRAPKSGETPARIAFLLMLHKRNLRQVRRLLGAIYDRNHYYYIHVDARQHYLFRELLNLEKDYPNVHVARQRYSPVWGCDSQLQAILLCIQAILAMPSWEPDFVINMSESDFPVKSVTKLTSFLTANPGRNFLLQQQVLTPEMFMRATGMNKNFVECSGRMWSIGERVVPTGIVYNGGSDWFGLSKEFAKYIIDTDDDLVGDLQALIKYSGFGTENYFHTLLHNSRFCKTHYDSNLRLVSWKKGHGCSKSDTIDWIGCSPVCIRDEDWPRLMHMIASNDDIFLARKFNPVFDQAVILRMEEKIAGKHPANTPNLNSYWENVYHRCDHEHNHRTAALTKIAQALLNSYGHENNVHRYDALNVLEITHYFDRNTFYGFLIRHEAFMHDRIVELELLVRPRKMFNLIYPQTSELNTKALQMYVTNNVDKTEQLPTDFDQVLTVDQTPILVVHLPTDNKLVSNSINHTVRVDWINPHREVISVQEFTINENPSTSNKHVLGGQMNLPLMPGPWEAKVFFNESVVGIVEFLLTSNEPSPQCNTCTKCPPVVFGDVIENQCKIRDRDLYFRAFPHPRATLKHFFEIKKVCALYEKTVEYSLEEALFENCYETLWSSVATDPKSDMRYLVKRQQLSGGTLDGNRAWKDSF